MASTSSSASSSTSASSSSASVLSADAIQYAVKLGKKGWKKIDAKRIIPVVPPLYMKANKVYAMCDFVARDGPDCTSGLKCKWAHSPQERKLWNVIRLVPHLNSIAKIFADSASGTKTKTKAKKTLASHAATTENGVDAAPRERSTSEAVEELFGVWRTRNEHLDAVEDVLLDFDTFRNLPDGMQHRVWHYAERVVDEAIDISSDNFLVIAKLVALGRKLDWSPTETIAEFIVESVARTVCIGGLHTGSVDPKKAFAAHLDIFQGEFTLYVRDDAATNDIIGYFFARETRELRDAVVALVEAHPHMSVRVGKAKVEATLAIRHQHCAPSNYTDLFRSARNDSSKEPWPVIWLRACIAADEAATTSATAATATPAPAPTATPTPTLAPAPESAPSPALSPAPTPAQAPSSWAAAAAPVSVPPTAATAPATPPGFVAPANPPSTSAAPLTDNASFHRWCEYSDTMEIRVRLTPVETPSVVRQVAAVANGVAVHVLDTPAAELGVGIDSKTVYGLLTLPGEPQPKVVAVKVVNETTIPGEVLSGIICPDPSVQAALTTLSHSQQALFMPYHIQHQGAAYSLSGATTSETGVITAMPLALCSVESLVTGKLLADGSYVDGAQLGTDELVFVAASMAHATHALFTAGVRFGDIRPSNFLVLRDGRVVLSDYGYLRVVDLPSAAENLGLTEPPKFSHAGFRFQAPEVLAVLARKPGADLLAAFELPTGLDAAAATASAGLLRLRESAIVFTLGVALAFVGSGGQYPFGPDARDHDLALIAMLNSGKPVAPDLAGITDLFLRDLVVWMLDAEPSKRPSLAAVVKHPAFCSADASAATLDRLERALRAGRVPPAVRNHLESAIGDMITPGACAWNDGLQPGTYETLVPTNAAGMRPAPLSLEGLVAFVTGALSAPSVDRKAFLRNHMAQALLSEYYKAREAYTAWVMRQVDDLAFLRGE
ncbi:serine/threonine protein kinase [Thecamonas trahens ATCC 50062]|uniref:Serine/threonine protein kinase n=1 Tax=Thecamonas trahens ATCC 50062 TaxID=461836 RepID=A0A0L0D8H7_THETB|nr:serine/threonine protein kinase [Thecamonas trahens ATCC 50062]KNC47583.1 serine/threonine protein kinase [Thecamonas trahens ATCC 50062]|eukprot:XP_013759513.1 serine/threonine protein kinase [Thecamonas trahens ATCC 50062]